MKDSRIAALIEQFRQVEQGKDIPAPSSLLSRLKAEDAAFILPHAPYSILTNLAHAVFWQDVWLKRLRGERAPSFTGDWRVPEAEEWPTVRERFMTGFAEVQALLQAEPLDHKMKSDEAALQTLTQIAIHNSYHLGQINLLKRSLRKFRRQPEDDQDS